MKDQPKLKLRKMLNDKDGKIIETLNDKDVGMFYCPNIPLQIKDVE